MKLEFKCTGSECKTSCCGPFEGKVEPLGVVSCHHHSSIPIPANQVVTLIKRGVGSHLTKDSDGSVHVILEEDKSCPMYQDNKCSIYEDRPPVCRAYPFYISQFGGVAVDTTCEGVKFTGKENEFPVEMKGLKEAYQHQIDKIQIKREWESENEKSAD